MVTVSAGASDGTNAIAGSNSAAGNMSSAITIVGVVVSCVGVLIAVGSFVFLLGLKQNFSRMHHGQYRRPTTINQDFFAERVVVRKQSLPASLIEERTPTEQSSIGLVNHQQLYSLTRDATEIFSGSPQPGGMDSRV